MKTKTYVLVVNLRSRQSARLIKAVTKIFEKKKLKVKILPVDNPKELTKAFKKAVSLKPDVIALGGGDGTLISGIEYLMNNKFKGDIGILPLGTANYLARDLSIPLDLKGSVEVLLNGTKKEVPIGIANGRLFALTFILGLTQAVSENVSDKRKRKLGQLAYIIELFKQTFKHEAFSYVIKSPSLPEEIKGKTHQIVVYNADLNQQVKLVPGHELQKRTLKVVISNSGRSKWRLYYGFLVHIITLGKVRPYLKVFEATSLSIETSPSVTADYDGEVNGESPYKIGMYKKRVFILAP